MKYVQTLPMKFSFVQLALPASFGIRSGGHVCFSQESTGAVESIDLLVLAVVCDGDSAVPGNKQKKSAINNNRYRH